MKTEKYVYNTKTLQFEKHKATSRQKIFRFTGNVFGLFFAAAVIYVLTSNYLPSLQEQALQRELEVANLQLKTVTNKMKKAATDIDYLHEKDASVHRMILGVEPIDQNVWEGGVGGHNKYAYLESYPTTGEQISESLSSLDRLTRKIKMQKSSFDTLHQLAAAKEDRLASIPSIKPIQEDKLKRKIKYLSGYGIRVHPVHKVRKFHKGIDFTAPRGTPIVASGNGTVIRVENKRFGYGKNVIIDHGYGYSTLYGHMHEILVKKGEKIIRGQIIGKVGSSGTSTAPHLHYEVRINKKPVNPIDYCLDGLSLEEYKELVHKSSIENQSFD